MKKIFGLAIFLLVVGAIFLGISTYMGVDVMAYFKDIWKMKETNKEETLDTFDSINLDVDSSFVQIIYEDIESKIAYYEDNENTVTFEIVNNSLNVVQKRKFHLFSLGFSISYLKIYVPSTTVLSIAGKISAGGIINISNEEVSFNSIDISLSSGNIHLENIISPLTTLNLSSGSLSLKGIDSQELTIKQSSGSANIEALKCYNLSINKTSGSLTLKSIEVLEKLNIKSTSGSIKIDEAIVYDTTIRSNSGGIRLNVARMELTDINYTVVQSSGSFSLNGKKADRVHNIDSLCHIYIKSDSGSVKINY
jgi:DUF4097 and DUF4098 domain-containing protein YvlB